MKIAIAGGHGTIARHLTRLLTDAGHEVTSLIRDPDQIGDIDEVGGSAVVVDLEEIDGDALAGSIHGADAVVFAAGAGPGSDAARKETVDHLGAVKLLAAASIVDADHYLMISSMGADAGREGDEGFDAYLRAKGKADDAVRAGSVPHTIVRPASLTDDAPTGTVTLTEAASGDEISRQDVAAVLHSLLERGPLDATVQLTAGATAIADAVAAL